MSYGMGARLKAARECRGKKVHDLAELLNLTDRGYRNYENNKRDLSTATLKTICTYLNVSSEYILGLSDDMDIKQNCNQPLTVQVTSKIDANKKRITDLFDSLTDIQQENVIARAELYAEQNEEALRQDSG